MDTLNFSLVALAAEGAGLVAGEGWEAVSFNPDSDLSEALDLLSLPSTSVEVVEAAAVGAKLESQPLSQPMHRPQIESESRNLSIAPTFDLNCRSVLIGPCRELFITNAVAEISECLCRQTMLLEGHENWE